MIEATCVNGHTTEIEDASFRFCKTCGAALLDRCPNGHTLKPEAAFCRICGAPASDQVGASPTGMGPGSAEVAQWGSTAPTAAVRPNSDVTRVLPTTFGASGGSAGTPPPNAFSTSPGPSEKKRPNPFVWVAVGLAVLLAGVAVVIAVGSSHSHTAVVSVTHVQKTTNHSQGTTVTTQTTAPPSTTSPAQSLAQGEASTLSGLLAQSANDRSAIVAAVSAIANCGDLQTAEGTLTASATSRQSLLQQLQSLNLSSVPNSTELIEYLTAAWNNSIASDQSYAGWASDEINDGCTINDDSDLNYQNAQGSDSMSTSNKASFAAVWNPVASTFSLPTVTESSF
jgi:hypothetical protein